MQNNANTQTILKEDETRAQMQQQDKEKVNAFVRTFLKKYWHTGTYFKRFIFLAISVVLLSFLCNYLSIRTSFSFTTELLSKFTSYTETVSIAIAFLILFEVIQQVICIVFWKTIFKDGKLYFGLTAALIVCLSTSSILSSGGGQAWVEKNFSPTVTIDVEKLKKEQQEELNKIEKKIDHWTKVIEAKDDYVVKTVTIPNLEKEATKIRDRNAIALAKAEQSNTDVISEDTTARDEKANTVSWLGLAVPLVLFICSGYFNFFLFKSARQYDIITAKKTDNEPSNDAPTPTTAPTTEEKKKTVPNPLHNEVEPIATATYNEIATPKQIGFKLPNPSQNSSVANQQNPVTTERNEHNAKNDNVIYNTVAYIMYKGEKRDKTYVKRNVSAYRSKVNNNVGVKTTNQANLDFWEEQLRIINDQEQTPK